MAIPAPAQGIEGGRRSDHPRDGSEPHMALAAANGASSLTLGVLDPGAFMPRREAGSVDY